MIKITNSITILVLLSGCAYSSLQPETYSRDAAQEMRDVFYGEVVKVKTVNIEGDIKSGSLVGGVVGAAAGSGVSDGEIESSIGATLGAAVGSAVGSKLSQKITKKEGVQLGVIAQEIKEVMPELVDTRDNGYLAVKYDKIVPLLIESIKELKKEIEELKSK